MQLTSNAAASPFSTQPLGPRPVGCFSALLARPVSIQIWALRSRLEKQPTDLRRRHHYMRDGALGRDEARRKRSRRAKDFGELSRAVHLGLVALVVFRGSDVAIL